MRPTAEQTGSGCGGDLHPSQGCATCRRRTGGLPRSPDIRKVGELGVMRTPGLVLLLQSAIGFGLALGSVPIWKALAGLWLILAAVMDLVGVAFVYHGLFTRASVVIDGRGREFIESRRALFRAPVDLVRSFAEIAFVGLDHFYEQTYEDGRFKERQLKANVWLQWTDGDFRSFGSGFPADARSLAEQLHEFTEAPLRTTGVGQSPTSDRWTLSSSE